jgi:hypothetical protein
MGANKREKRRELQAKKRDAMSEDCTVSKDSVQVGAVLESNRRTM